MNNHLRHINLKYEFCVIGGGLSGTIAAISAAREGAKVVLIQDRPVLGGNSSSEIRMWVRGAKKLCNRETGILAELEEENIYRNPYLAHTIWDSVLYGKIKEEKNIDLLLNCSVTDAACDGEFINRITAWQLTTYTWFTISARYFADCSGDSILAPIVGAEYRFGREGRSEFNESLAPEKADTNTMGMSCLIAARERDESVKYTPPKWANVYKTDADFAMPSRRTTGVEVRDHKIGTSGCNLWWMELGGDMDSIHDAETMRDELLKISFGVWDHVKNQDDHGYQNWDLYWVGFLPGKRESRRYVGDYILTQNDVNAEGKFDDIIAYGGWPMDDHNPKGMKATGLNEPPSLLHPAPSPYGIPYRVLYSKNIKNLLFAGRNISATHIALSSTRVMATCSLLGQAMGTAVGMCLKKDLLPRDLFPNHIPELQNKLMDAGVFLPWKKRRIPHLAMDAKLNIADEMRSVLFNGIERPREDENVKNYISLNKGSELIFDLREKKNVKSLRIQFDLDYSRKSVSENLKMQWFALKLHEGKDFKPMTVAKTLVKDFEVYADDVLVLKQTENYHSLVNVPLNLTAFKIRVKFNETWGHDKVNLFGCDITD